MKLGQGLKDIYVRSHCLCSFRERAAAVLRGTGLKHCPYQWRRALALTRVYAHIDGIETF